MIAESKLLVGNGTICNPDNSPPRISFYQNIRGRSSKIIDLSTLLETIRTGKGIKEQIEAIRAVVDKNKVDALKKMLPAITPSGIFGSNRRLSDLVEYSGILCLDFDSVQNIVEKKEQLKKDPYCYAAFISPSGNGLKVFVKVGSDVEKHLDHFMSLTNYYVADFDLIADSSCKDVTRLMFLSHDEHLILNLGSQLWSFEENFEFQFRSAKKRLDLKDSFQIGNRNTYIYKLAGSCFRSGIPEGFVTLKILSKYVESDFLEPEIVATIQSAYGSAYNVDAIAKENLGVVNLSLLARIENYISAKYDIRFNEVSTKIECKTRGVDQVFKELNENSLYRELQHANLNISMAKLSSLMQSDFVINYNPLEDYFESLEPWVLGDGEDYIGKLAGYLSIKDRSRFIIHFVKMFVRSVACALDDRVFNKQVFVLVHDMQNSGKSTFCRWLCPPSLINYLTESINTDKDSLIALGTNFLINMDELATLSRAEINSLKSFISKDKINVRLPFAKKATVMPRRANFIGSTNKDEFLTDETGSVRWLCFELTGMIDFKYKTEMSIDDIWRQAYGLFKSGFEYQLTSCEIEENEKANSTFQITSMEMELIPKHFLPSSKAENGIFVTATDIHTKLSGLYPAARLNIQSIGRAMKKLGFIRDCQYRGDRLQSLKGYFISYLEV